MQIRNARKENEMIAMEEAILATISCPITLQIFRHPAMLTGTAEVVELEAAQTLMNTTQRGLDNRPITGYTEIFHLNHLIEHYMKIHPNAERYPEYTKADAKNEIPPDTAAPSYLPTSAPTHTPSFF
jgi:hypothetical protein